MARKNITIPKPNTSVPSSRTIIGLLEVPEGKATCTNWVVEAVTIQSCPIKTLDLPPEYKLSQCHAVIMDFTE